MAETGFKTGTASSILNSDVLYGYNEKGRQNLNLKNSFYVQIPYEDIDGAHTVDAILTPNGNSWGLDQYGYSLTDMNGKPLTDVSPYLYNVDDIRVYDVPPSEFGNAKPGVTPHINDGTGRYVSSADNSYITVIATKKNDIGNIQETRFTADGLQTGTAVVDAPHGVGTVTSGDLSRFSADTSTGQPATIIQDPTPAAQDTTTTTSSNGDYYDSSMTYGEGTTKTTSEPQSINGGQESLTTTTITDSNGNVVGTEECRRSGNHMEVTYKDANGNVVRKETYNNTNFAEGKPKPSTTTNYENVYGDNGTDIVGTKETTFRSNGDVIVTNKDANGNVLTTKTTTYTYNEDHTKAVGYTEVTKNAKGDIVQTKVVKQDKNVQTTEFYDGQGKITQRNVTVDGKSTKREYYKDGKLTKIEETVKSDGKTATITTEYKSDGKTVRSVERDDKTGAVTTTTKVYDSKGKEVASTKVTEEKDANGVITRTTITADGTKVEKIYPDGKVETVSEKGSLAKYATENSGNRGDGTLGSNLSLVHDSMQEIKGKITEHTELSHTPSSSREAGIIGSMYGAANFYGNVTDALYGKLSAEADAIYDIANTIYQMDNVLDSSTGLLASKDLKTDSAIFNRENFGRQLNDLQAASDALKSGTQETITAAKQKYNDVLDQLNTVFSTDKGGSTPGVVSMDAINAAVSAIIPALNEEVAKADGLSASVDSFMGMIGGENMLKGGIWEDVATNMENFQNLLKLNKDAANELSERIKTAMGWIQAYMSSIGATEVDTDKLDEFRETLEKAKRDLENAENKLREIESCVPEYDTAGNCTKSCEDPAPYRAEVEKYRAIVEEFDKKVKDIEGLIPIINKAQEYISECVSQIEAAYADPVAYAAGNINFESSVDIQPLIDSGLIDGSTDYSKLINDYYEKIKPTSTTQPGAETQTEAQAGSTEGATTPKDSTEPDDDDGYYPGGGGTPSGGGEGSDPSSTPTTPSTEALTDPTTEAPTEAPTQAPTEAPTEIPTEKPTEGVTTPSTETPTEANTEAPGKETKPSGGTTKKTSGGGTSKKPTNPNVETKPTEPAIIDTQDAIITEPVYEEPVIEDDYFEPIVEDEEVPIDLDPIEIPTDAPTPSNNGLKTMGIAAGVGLAVGASALGAHTIMKSKEDDEGDDDFGYEK